MERDLFKKQFGEFVEVEVEVKDGKLQSVQSLDIGAVLDKAATAMIQKIPGDWEVPMVLSVVNMLRAEIGLEPHQGGIPAPAAEKAPA